MLYFWQIHMLFCLYVFYCFYAYCDGEYYNSFVTVSAVGKQVMCGVCIYNKKIILPHICCVISVALHATCVFGAKFSSFISTLKQ